MTWALPRITIAVPTWNGAAHLGEALESAFEQGDEGVERLLVDDGSQDETLEIARLYEPRGLVVYRNEHRLGLPGNWNRALVLARGRMVQLLLQDDVLAQGSTARLAAGLETNRDAALAFGRREVRFEGLEAARHPLGREAYTGTLASFLETARADFDGTTFVGDALRAGRSLTVNVIGEPSFVLLRRDAALAAGGFFEGLAQLPDWDLWLRLLRRGRAAFVDGPTGTFRVHGRASSAALDPLALARENLALLRRVRGDYTDGLGPAERRHLRDEIRRARVSLLGATLRKAAAGAWSVPQ
jgi:glycosyltransferase involved in cell wall biosynthesis